MTRTQTKEREPAPDLLQGVAPPPTKTKKKNEIATVAAPKPPKEPKPDTSVLSVIARIAADPAIDTDKMRAVIEIQRDTDAKLPRINKDGKIEMSRGGKAILFASFENLNRQIKPILREFGFRMNYQPDTPPTGVGIVVHCHLTKGLYRESCTVPISVASASPAMNAQQSVGAAIKYACRYGTIALLNIETEAPEDRDNNAATPVDMITEKQGIALLDLIDKNNVPLGVFTKKYKIAKIGDLPAKFFDEAAQSCRDYPARVAERRKQS